MELVMELVGCGPKEAAQALADHKEIWLAVDALLKKPQVSGEKYIPEKPTIDTGLDQEQKERCERGRWLQDKVNAVFSVAHSKTQIQPDAEAHLTLPLEKDVPSQVLELTLQQPDVVEQTTLPTQQSLSLH